MGAFPCPPSVSSSRFSFSGPALIVAAVAVCLASSANRANAQLVINELYYDHPGSDGGFEFVEIMNVSASSVPLVDVAIEFHNGSGEGWEALWHGDEGQLAPGTLFVVGGGGVQPSPDAVSSFSLQNGPDALRLTLAGDQSDLVAYGGLEDAGFAEGESAPGVPAGRSLSRIPDGSDTDNNSVDFAETDPSPGGFNVPRFDAAISVVAPTRHAAALPEHGRETLSLAVSNGGESEIAPGGVEVVLRDSTGTSSNLLLCETNAAPISIGSRSVFSTTVSLASGYHWLLANIGYERDERLNNNSLVLLRRVGGPALLISEVLCSPSDGCPQFVEIYNAGDRPVDIAGFKMRDASHPLTSVTGRSLVVPPGGYVAVTPQADALVRCFPATPTERLVEHAGSWPTLNRTGSGGVSDSVVLADALSLAVDVVAYPPVDSDYEGKSLERVDLFLGASTQTWVLSRDPSGASPGRPNTRSLFEAPARESLEVAPKAFSPFNGETTTISIDTAPDRRAVVSVYDVEGRRLAELGSAIAFPAVFVWDGRDRGGHLLMPGIYVVVCELFAGTGERVAARKVVVGCGRRAR